VKFIHPNKWLAGSGGLVIGGLVIGGLVIGGLVIGGLVIGGLVIRVAILLVDQSKGNRIGYEFSNKNWRGDGL
jgi:hypothetical protein